MSSRTLEISSRASAMDPSIPFLPGNSFHDIPIMRKTHHKPHHFDVQNGIPTALAALQETYHPPEYKKLATFSKEAIAQPTKTPPWLSANNVLRFQAYFTEPVIESAVETMRMRRCSIYFHTEDNTVMVREGNQPNSGMDGGVLIRRMRVELEEYGNRIAELRDFNVGIKVRLYGKEFHIIGCDSNTRNHLEAEGIPVPPNEPFPTEHDHFGHLMAKRAARENQPKKLLNFTDMEMKRHHEYMAMGHVTKPTPSQVAEAQQFFRNSGKKLKFYSVWDDRGSLHGDLRKLLIVVHLEDDTIELLAENEGGRDSNKILLRQRIPHPLPGTETFSNTSLFDHINKGASQQLTFGVKMEHSYLTADDFRIGKYVHIHGKNFFIYDCDGFTREHFVSVGNEQPPAINPDTYFNTIPMKPPRLRPPPYDGVGSEEDSLGNWRNLLLRPPPRDHRKWLTQAGKILHFGLRMIRSWNATIEEEGRHFILSYYLENDTLQIDEVAIRNSGMGGGKYLTRQRVSRILPDGQEAYYTADDFKIGKVVTIFGHQFEVVDIDARSEKMLNGVEEETSDEYIRELVVKLRETVNIRFHRVQEAFRAIGANFNGSIDVDELIEFYRTMNITVKRQDAKTILSMFDRNGDGVLDFAEFTGLMHGNAISHKLDELALSPKSVHVDRETRRQFAETTVKSTSPLLAKAPLTTTAPPMGDYVDRASVRNSDSKRTRIVLQKFRDKTYERRVESVEVYRLLGGISPDSKLYPEPFRKGLKTVLHLLLPPDEIDVLCGIFFPDGEPCTFEQFQTIMEGGCNGTGGSHPLLKSQTR